MKHSRKTQSPYICGVCVLEGGDSIKELSTECGEHSEEGVNAAADVYSRMRGGCSEGVMLTYDLRGDLELTRKPRKGKSCFSGGERTTERMGEWAWRRP